MRLTPADRCALLFIQVVAVVGFLSGLVMWSNKGYSASALVFVVAGGSINVAVTCGLVCNVCRKQESDTEPIIDRPPKYRLTWRKEFLKSIPDDLKADIEGSFGLEKKKKKKRKDRDRDRERPRVIWTSESANVHQARERPLEVSGGVGSPDFGASSPQQNRVQAPAVVVAAVHGISHSTPGTGRPPSRSFLSGDLGAYSTQADDDGLPSYEEVQRWF